ncbi:MAG: 4Fe-4S binding protein [bacterium]|nr:MAG: 4Fe-4S binding protein [bacterium]
MDACDFGAIYLLDNKAQIDQSQCTACGACVKVYPTHAIQVEHA